MFSPSSSCMTLVSFLIIMIALCNAHGPPSPGYSPSSKFPSINFSQGYANQWGPQHQSVDNGVLKILLDRSSGSGFRSFKDYRSTYIAADIKLHPGYTAGIITCLFLSNHEDHPGHHDEIDIEFLGTIPGKPYTLQTNIYINGSGDGVLMGREEQYHLWFDPTKDFHNYALLYTQNEIIFLVDDVPIRRYPKKSNSTFPLRPMKIYGSIWDASSWATDGGKYKANYKYQPFIGLYKNFKIVGCTTEDPESCLSPSVSPSISGGLTQQQYAAMAWVQRHNLGYDYCKNPSKNRSKIPECFS